jgi:poly-gamma-glutamate capsule biosynthesis protein CapA/YwtB (metallophosphatase superfamily)
MHCVSASARNSGLTERLPAHRWSGCEPRLEPAYAWRHFLGGWQPERKRTYFRRRLIRGWQPLQHAAGVLLLLFAGPALAQDVIEAPTLTIAAVGDMMIGTEYPDDRLPDDDGASYFAAVRPWLESADITFGNLEGVLADEGEPGKKCSNPAACFRFRSPSRYVRHFKEAGFDVLSLANNHARDFDEAGRTTTMRILNGAGILHSGRVGTAASFEQKGIRIAVIAYAVTKNSNMMLDYLFAERTIADVAANHDIVIVSFHGGAEGEQYTNVTFAEEEYYDEPRGDVVRFARLAVDAGADLVLGHGPHVVRAMERYNDRLIAYSLGNFATHFGISISGIKGVAPILIARLDREGRFLDGEIVSTVQERPNGPAPDPAKRARSLIERLSREDFGAPGLEFRADGVLLPAERPPVTRRRTFGPDDDPGENGPKPCNENWFWLIESTVKQPEEAALGPEPATADWQSIVMQRLGVEDVPPREPASPEWCELIDRRVFGDVN